MEPDNLDAALAESFSAKAVESLCPAKYIAATDDGLRLEVGHDGRGTEVAVPTSAQVVKLLDGLASSGNAATSLQRWGRKGAKKPHWTAADLGRFVNSSGVGELRTLDLSRCPLEAASLTLLGEGALSSLERLQLDGVALDDAAIDALLGGRWPSLHTLTLGTVGSAHQLLRIVEGLPALRSLTAGVVGCEHKADGATAWQSFASAKPFARLERFEPTGWNRGQDLLRPLTARGDLSLRSLHLGSGDHDLGALFDSPWIGQLRQLTGLTVSSRNLDSVVPEAMQLLQTLRGAFIGKDLDPARVMPMLGGDLTELSAQCDAPLATRILEDGPAIRHLELSKAYLEQLSVLPEAARLDTIRSLTIATDAPAALLEALTQRDLPNLHTLVIRGGARPVDFEGRSLEAASWLPGLRRLELHAVRASVSVSLENATQLVHAVLPDAGGVERSGTPALETLDLRQAPRNSIDNAAFKRLTASSLRPRLRTLALPGDPTKTKPQRRSMEIHPRVRVSLG